MHYTCGVVLNIQSVLIILVIVFHGFKLFQKDSLRDRLFMLMQYLLLFMLILDTLDRVVAYTGASGMGRAGFFAVILMSPVLPSLWVAYLHFHVFYSESRTQKMLLTLCIINAVYAAVLVCMLKYGLVRIAADVSDYASLMYLLPSCVVTMFMLCASVMVVTCCRKLEKRTFFTLIFVCVPPVLAAMLQMKFHELPLILNSAVPSLLAVFLNIQNHYLYTDYLTGISNRKKLDMYLKEKASLSTPGKGFSAILLDINNFKYINDTYGHDTGDDALVTAARLLKGCLRNGDFIARFGGDEFLIIIDITNEKDLEALTSRINSCLDRYNSSGLNHYEIRFSMGYAVYDRRLHKSPEEFLRQIDRLMYENKHTNKTIKNYIKYNC